ncbi:MAG TPA: UDP-glucose 4-epimerase GalE [Anaerolineae bacterium]|nr:UDP-glucose 4-epimerase GalE [Anaerolineae bacterium]
MNILVTGGAGYIGSVATEELVKAGHQVVVYDSLLYGHRGAVHPRAIFEQGDLADKARLAEVFDGHTIDAVMHFAAHSVVPFSMRDPLPFVRDNVGNAINLLEVMASHDVKRFILSSTANVYGEPERVPIQEDDRLAPSSPYGESKLMIERMLHWCEVRYGLRYATLRYFNAAGASEQYGEDHEPETHLIPLVLKVALGLKDHLDIYGDDYSTRDGTCVRDYIHVVDLAQAHVLALDALDESSRVYNLGNGQGFTVQEVIATVREVTGHPIPARITPRRPGDPATLLASSSKIRRELGWEPRYPDVADIIDSAWRWTRTHPNGYAQ